MTIQNIQIPFGDFKLQDVIDPDQFDANNKVLSDAVNTVVTQVNTNTLDISLRYDKATIDSKLDSKTSVSGNHAGTWQGLTPSQIGASDMNASRIDKIEQTDLPNINDSLSNHERSITLLEAYADIDGRAVGNTGKFYEFLDGSIPTYTDAGDYSYSNSVFESARGIVNGTPSSGATLLTLFDSVSDFQVGEEVTIYDDTVSERVTITNINASTKQLTITPLINAYKAQPNVARSMGRRNPITHELDAVGWQNYVTDDFTVSKKNIESFSNSSGLEFTMHANGQHNIVKLQNGTLVACVFQPVNSLYIFQTSYDNGLTWHEQNTIQDGGLVDGGALLAIGYDLFFACAGVDKSIRLYKTTASSSGTFTFDVSKKIILQPSSAVSDVSNAYFSITHNNKGKIGVAYSVKSTQYTPSQNIFAVESLDYGVTWSAVQNVTNHNSAGYDNFYPNAHYLYGKLTVAYSFKSISPDHCQILYSVQQSDGTFTWGGGSTLYDSGAYEVGRVSSVVFGGVLYALFEQKDSVDASVFNLRFVSTSGVNIKVTAGNSYAQTQPCLTVNGDGMFILKWTSYGGTGFYSIKKATYQNSTLSTTSTLTSTSVNNYYPNMLYDAYFGTRFDDAPTVTQNMSTYFLEFSGLFYHKTEANLTIHDFRFVINAPNGTTDEIITWVTPASGGTTITGALSIVDDASNELFADMTKEITSSGETQLIGSVATKRSRITLRITTNVFGLVPIRKLLGAIG